MSIGKKGAKSGEYSVIYSNMRGVDLRGDGGTVAPYRFADLINMYKDYEGEGEGVIESVPGYRRLLNLGDECYGLFSFKNSKGIDTVCVHSGTRLVYFSVESTKGTPSPKYFTGIGARKSAAYSHDGSLYILDGENIFKLGDEGVYAVGEESAYIPTLYKNGVEYEQINLLTDSFRETTLIGSAASAAYGTPELKYAIIDEEMKKCSVTGIGAEVENVFIPSQVRIGEKIYEVSEIGDRAFRSNTHIKSVFIADGLSRIGFLAFDGCSSLKSAILPETIVTVAEGAFGSCIELERVHLGSALREIGAYAFNVCPSLANVTYSRDRSNFDSVIGKSYIPTEVECNSQNSECYIAISLHAPAVSITEIKIDGVAADGFTPTFESGLIKKIIFKFDSRSDIEGRTVDIYSKLSKRKSDYGGERSGFLGSSYLDDGNIYSIIGGCTVAESFDGRIFLTGNPKYPGYTFYSHSNSLGKNDPLYFGELNYFLDGEGSFGNIALLATSDALAVFKENDKGGSIFYRCPRATGIDLLPKVYEVGSMHTGFSASGGAISFFDDPVFVSKKGICALTKKSINSERCIEVRSTNVNPSLLSENISEASLAVWRGYLAVSVGGKIYLADSRQTFSGTGGLEYEWYVLSGIGSYKNASGVFRYSPEAKTGFFAKGTPDEKAEATVYSMTHSGETVYYTVEDGIRYQVYATDEVAGGDFYAAKYIISVADRLIFTTSAGAVLIFNNDKRGAAPPGADKDEAPPKNKLHPYYYSFDRHAPRYAIKTAKDCCGMPHLSKNTVKHSLSMKLKARGSGSFTLEVFCDTKGYRELCKFPSGSLSFSELDFSNLTMQTEDSYTVPFAEHEKRWVEKQISVYTDEYESPFGIYSIAYRFTVRGKIKKNR